MVYSWSKLLSIINFQRPKPFQTPHVTPIPKPLPCFGVTGSGSRAYMDVSRRHFGSLQLWLSLYFVMLGEKWRHWCLFKWYWPSSQSPATLYQWCLCFCSTFLTPVACRASETHSGFFIHINRLGGWMRQFSWGVMFWRLWNEMSKTRRESEFGMISEETQTDSVWTIHKKWNV